MATRLKKLAPSEVRLGDLVRMSQPVDDCIMSMVGTVGKRKIIGKDTYFYSRNGILLGVAWHGGIPRLGISLIPETKAAQQEALEGIIL